MRVVVFSSTRFGLRCIEEAVLRSAAAELVGSVTTPRCIDISYSDKPVEIASHAEFGPVAKSAGAELLTLSQTPQASEYHEFLDRVEPDLILVLGWYYNVGRKIREAAPLGCLGIHASLLPRYRGGAPLPWAIINGETETGVSLFHLVDEIDAGDIVGQQAFAIDKEDDIASVYVKAEDASIALLLKSLPRLAAGGAPRLAQDESQATVFPQRKPEDGLIDWSWDVERINNFIRAQTKPYPGAFFYLGGKKVHVWDATITADERAVNAA